MGIIKYLVVDIRRLSLIALLFPSNFVNHQVSSTQFVWDVDEDGVAITATR